MATTSDPQGVCAPIFEPITELEEKCGVKNEEFLRCKYGALIKNRFKYEGPGGFYPKAPDGITMSYYPNSFYSCEMLFQDIKYNNTLHKRLIDFYNIMRIKIFSRKGHHTDEVDHHLQHSYPLSILQGGQDVGDKYIINPLKQDVKIRELIIHMNNTCEFQLDRLDPKNNRFINPEFVFFNTKKPVTSKIKPNYTVIKEKIHYNYV